MCICIVRREGKKEHGVQSRHQEVRVFLWVRNTKNLFLFYLPLLPFFKTPPNHAKKELEKKKEEEEETVVVVRINRGRIIIIIIIVQEKKRKEDDDDEGVLWSNSNALHSTTIGASLAIKARWHNWVR